jgi:hypothetical protein
LASSTATSVSDATAARCRNSKASGAGSSAPARITAPIASSPERTGTSAITPGGTGAGRSRIRSAT